MHTANIIVHIVHFTTDLGGAFLELLRGGLGTAPENWEGVSPSPTTTMTRAACPVVSQPSGSRQAARPPAQEGLPPFFDNILYTFSCILLSVLYLTTIPRAHLVFLSLERLHKEFAFSPI